MCRKFVSKVNGSLFVELYDNVYWLFEVNDVYDIFNCKWFEV